ncbi:MAG: hypothetical protein ABR548_07645 [Actinomycetota bacterium]|nr:hypothetical protein [Actinomycetota bacterium]
MKLARFWVVAFVLVIATFGFGQLEAWPFTSWYMFSHVEPAEVHVAEAFRVAPGGAVRPLSGDLVPLGLQSHRLLAVIRRDEGGACAGLLRAARVHGGGDLEVRVYEKSWRVLDRTGDRPAHVEKKLLAVCR